MKGLARRLHLLPPKKHVEAGASKAARPRVQKENPKGNGGDPLKTRAIKVTTATTKSVRVPRETSRAFRELEKELDCALHHISKGDGQDGINAVSAALEALAPVVKKQPGREDLPQKLCGAHLRDALPKLSDETLVGLERNLRTPGTLPKGMALVMGQMQFSVKAEMLHRVTNVQPQPPSQDKPLDWGGPWPESGPSEVERLGLKASLLDLSTLSETQLDSIGAFASELLVMADTHHIPNVNDKLSGTQFTRQDLADIVSRAQTAKTDLVIEGAEEMQVDAYAERAARIERESHEALENAEQQLGHAVDAVLADDPQLAQQSIELVSDALELIAQRNPHEPDLIRRLCGEWLRDGISDRDRDSLEQLEKGLAPLLRDRAKLLKDRSNARRAQPSKDFPDSVSLILFQLNFSVKAQLLLLKTDAMVKLDIGFGEAEVYATSDWPEEELMDLISAAVHLVELAESYPPADTTLPGAQLTMAQVRAIERAALMARNALDMVPKWEKAADRRAIDLVEKAAYTPVKNMSGAELKALKEAVNRLMAKSDEDDLDDEGYLEPEQLTKLDAQIQEAEKVITVRVIGPVHVFDTSKLSGEKLDALLAEIAALVHVPRALMKAKREILAQRLTTAKAECQTALKEALRETYRGRTADTLLRSAVKAQTAMHVFARLGKTLDTRTLSRWTQEAVRAEKKKNGTAGLQAMQNSLALGEGKAIRDLLSKRAVSGPVTALSYLGVLSDVLTASLPVGAASSAQSSTGATVLSVDAQAALLRHLGVDALPHPFDNADDLDVAIAIAEAGLELALRKGVVDLVHAEKLILQIPLVLSVTKDVDALTALKKLANSVIKAVGNQDAQTASDAQAVANMVDAKLAQDGAKTRTENGPSKLGVMNTRLKGRSIEAPTPDPKRVQFEKSREKKFPDPVIHPLEFSAKAELLRRKTDALEMRGTVFGGKNQHPVTALPEADLRELRDLYDLASELVKEAKAIAIGRRQDDAELPGTKFTLNKLERIQAYALDASDALGVR